MSYSIVFYCHKERKCPEAENTEERKKFEGEQEVERVSTEQLEEERQQG